MSNAKPLFNTSDIQNHKIELNLSYKAKMYMKR